VPAPAPAERELDHVDRVREQWREVRPDIDTAPIEIVARVGRLAAYFDQSINELMNRHGLARGSWDVLASLRRAGAQYELSPTELYRGLMRTSGAMTNRLRRLEQAGLIERVADPGDARGLLVRLTRPGLRLVDRVAAEHMDNERRMLEALSDRERQELTALLRKLSRWFEEHEPTPPRQGLRRP
jgi:DNA-binding MarR family transcriptional regulator